MPTDPLPPDNNSSSTSKGGIWHGVTWTQHPVGLLVFFIACIATLIMLIIVNAPLLWGIIIPEELNYRTFRSMELVLSIAGLGLIASVLSSTTSPIALVFGFFVVAALIIPTKDIVRFALIASGSDRTVNSYYGTATSGSSVSSRTEDVAKNAALAIEQIFEQRPNIDASFIDQQTRSLISSEIHAVLDRDRLETLIERVKARGAYELFEAIYDGTSQEFLYRHGESDRIEHDLNFLRYEDLISITYDSAETATVTDLGRSVVNFSRRGGATRDPETNRLIVPGINDWDLECSNLVFPLTAEALISTSATIAGVAPGKQYALTVSPDSVGTYTFNYSGQLGQLDPTLSLYRITSGNLEAASSRNCEKLASNDDGLNVALSTDAQITIDLSEGLYLLRLNSLWSTSEVGLFSMALSLPEQQ